MGAGGAAVVFFKVVSDYLLRRIEENHEKNSGQPDFKRRVEPSTSEVRSRSTNHSNVTVRVCVMDI